MKPHKKIPEPDITETEVLAHIASLTKPATTRQIAHGLNMRHHGRRLLPRMLAKLKSRGEVDELHGLRFRVSAQHRDEQKPKTPRGEHPIDALRKQGRDVNLVAGRLSAHRDGYGFVIPDQPIPKIDGDLFIPRDRMGDAMNGDRVVALITRWTLASAAFVTFSSFDSRARSDGLEPGVSIKTRSRSSRLATRSLRVATSAQP